MYGIADAHDTTDPGFEVRSSVRSGARVTEVIGALDIATAPALVRALARPGQSSIVDLRSCPFADSSGLAALIGAHREHFAAGHGFVLVVAPGSPIERLLSVTGVTHLLAAFPDVARAVAG